ncbi:MAG TPA: hypothetical protein VFJ18_03800 [Pararhizobium sp.]|nr:hypothetical protein [Pararhizobium sp.]
MAASFLMMSLAAGAIAFGGMGAAALPSQVELASADCHAAAERVVSRTGGQLLSVSAESVHGRTVCKVTVLVQGNGSKRPRKTTVTVEQ